MNHTTEQSVYFYCEELELEWADAVILEIDFYPGCDNRNSGEMIEVCGRRVRGPALDPPEPAEVELCSIEPVGGVVWSAEYRRVVEAAANKQFTDDILFEIINEECGP